MSAHENPEEYVEKYIGYNSKNHSILEEAVRQPENRRLGMLGDKVIGMVILDAWYRTPGLHCERGNNRMQLYGSNREMAEEARRAGFDDFVHPEMNSVYSRYYIHELATEVEAIVGTVWVDSDRNWEITKDCYSRIQHDGRRMKGVH